MKTTNLIHSGLFRMAARGYIAKSVQPQLHAARPAVVWGRLTWSRLRLDDAFIIDGRRRKILYRSCGVPLLFHGENIGNYTTLNPLLPLLHPKPRRDPIALGYFFICGGLREIDANVIELKSPVRLKVADFQHKCWGTGIEEISEENDMLSIDADVAKHAFEERLRQAEHEHLVQQMLANQPKPSARLRQWLSDFLIAFGTRLKVPAQQKFA